MFEGTPWILIAILVTLVIFFALVTILYRQMKSSGTSIFSVIHKKTFLIQLITGLACSLFGAFLMFNGKLLGNNTTVIAGIIGIIGICLIASSGPIGMAVKKRP